MSLTDSTDSSCGRAVSILWGCELSSGRSSFTFQVPEDWRCEQQLVLRTICLGETARDEFHVVEVVAEDGGGRPPVPLATLKPSVLPTATLAGVELTPPVTFRLRSGSGPVYVSGQHVSVTDFSSEDEDEEIVEETPEKPPKASSARKGGAAKKRKLEKEDEPNSLAREDPLPPKVGAAPRYPLGLSQGAPGRGQGPKTGGEARFWGPLPTFSPSPIPQGRGGRPGQESSTEEITGIPSEPGQVRPRLEQQQQPVVVVVWFPNKAHFALLAPRAAAGGDLGAPPTPAGAAALDLGGQRCPPAVGCCEKGTEGGRGSSRDRIGSP
ncbi:nucleoplasmin-2 isoform X2 [Poecile atricapillus]|uniref:nucleoplasmin-2 isoform X2 n=1 Tax=Poecile atricapillus TaxID=48891 RepID=UPI002739B9A9|nr:nucleoplasmin-2 isoform X2 [Poecile atricapillus]